MKRVLNVIAYILVIIGALNWGLWGFFQFDFVAWIFHGNTTGWSRVIYAIIGLAGVWCLGFSCRCIKELCCRCNRSNCQCKCHSCKCDKEDSCCKL